MLEDNVRTPSGFAYLHATRRALLEHIAVPPGAPPRPLDGEIDLLADALRAAAPESARGHRAPHGRGPHRRRAQLGLLGARLALAPARHPAGRARRARASAAATLWLRPRGLREPRRIDVLYRRTNADRLDSDLGRLLLEPVQHGALGLVNQYGTGVADDKLTHAYVEQMIRFYVGEEPVLRSVPTYDLAQPDAARRGARRLRRARAQAPRRPRRRRRPDRPARELARDRRHPRSGASPTRAPGSPSAWSMLSTHPTVVEGGRLAPRHIDLRPFVFLGEGCPPASAAGRPDPRRPLRGGAGRQLLAERRGEGHLGHAVT